MSSILRFDEWQDSNGVPVLDGTGGGLQLGKILQVVSTAKTNTYTVSLASGAVDSSNVTGLEVTITPTKSTNKLLVMGSISLGSLGERASFRLIRDGSLSSFVGDAAGSRTQNTSGQYVVSDTISASTSFMFLDNAVSTSATTYGVRLHNGSGAPHTIKVNEASTNTDSAGFGRYASSITVMEVAA